MRTPLIYSKRWIWKDQFPLLLGTVTTSFPPLQTAVAISASVHGGSRYRHTSTVPPKPYCSVKRSPPSIPLITIFVIPGRICIACALTPQEPLALILLHLHDATKRRNCVVSSIETSSSERKGSSSTLANTWGSFQSFLLFKFEAGLDETTAFWERWWWLLVRFFEEGWTFMVNMVVVCYNSVAAKLAQAPSR